ncbi:MAG TPA: MFS transporter [Candidatus Dormibacteraeota bacterium]|nr:MFS transporter [Candidatus Dormibacteraeota bacterium]
MSGPERLRRPRPQLWGHSDFLRLWAGQTVSELGSQISFIAIPLTAVSVLGAGAFQTGLLGTLQFLPFLLIGLPAGVWVDRLAHRPVLIAADVGRLVVMASIPIAWAFGRLHLPQLYAAGFAVGLLTVFFDVAYQSYLPALVEREQLVEGNSKLALTQSTSEVVGPGIGGLLVSLVGAPIAVAADAASYAVSVVSLLLIRRREPPSEERVRAGMGAELLEGLRYVLGHRLLRSIAACTGLSNLFSHMGMAVLIVYAVRELGLSAGTIGLWFSLGSLGGPLGALLVSRLEHRLGTGRTIAATAWLGLPSWILLVMAPRSAAMPFLIASGILGSLAGVAYNITQVSLRQAITPRPLQGRMNATMRFLVWGTIPVGSFIGGVIGSTVGLRAALLVAALGQLLAALPVTLGRVRRLRRVEDVAAVLAGA